MLLNFAEQTGKSRPSGMRWNGSGNAGYLIGAFLKRKQMKQDVKGGCRITEAMCGSKPHRQDFRRVKNRQQFGEPTDLRVGWGAGRQKPERNAFGHWTSKFSVA
jgi:hypothetical protein